MRTQPAAGPASGAPASDPAPQRGPPARAAGTVAAASGTFPGTAAPPNGAPVPAPPASGNGAGGPGRRTPLRRAVLAPLALAGRIPAMLRTHWLASILIAGGVVLRALAQMAYHPAIIYIDTLKYLYDNWLGSDPVGYKVPLKAILAVGDLGTVEVVQHLLGIAIAVTLYAVMVRRGVPRWLGAIAVAPVLLDAYQVQVIPALIFVLAMGGGWRKIVQNATAVICGFALALLFYLSADYQLAGHFWISRSSVSLTYGRMASVADCTTLRLPKAERGLCPSKTQQAQGPDWLDHSVYSPLRTFDESLPANLLGDKGQLVANFNKAVERQQPLRVMSGILHDSVKLFAVTRLTSPGDTPIVRWQFQRHFPTVQYGPWISVRNNAIWLDVGSLESSTLQELNPAFGGAPQVDKPIAAFLRSYQVRGGYTPGPLFALSLIAGLAGSVLAFMRRRRGAAARPATARVTAARQAAVACLFFFATGALVLGVSDLFEFTWRYQIPAIVTLPPAGALGIGALIIAARRPRDQVTADTVSGRAPEMAAPAP